MRATAAAGVIQSALARPQTGDSPNTKELPMRAGLPAFALLLLATAVAHAATDDEIRQKLIGSWGDTSACAKGALVFNADGTFAAKEADGSSRFEGTFEIKDGKLNGLVDKDAMPEMGIAFEEDTLVMSGPDAPDKLVRCLKS